MFAGKLVMPNATRCTDVEFPMKLGDMSSYRKEFTIFQQENIDIFCAPSRWIFSHRYFSLSMALVTYLYCMNK